MFSLIDDIDIDPASRPRACGRLITSNDRQLELLSALIDTGQLIKQRTAARNRIDAEIGTLRGEFDRLQSQLEDLQCAR